MGLLTSITSAQIMSINGKYPGWQPKSLPAVPGVEGTYPSGMAVHQGTHQHATSHRRIVWSCDLLASQQTLNSSSTIPRSRVTTSMGSAEPSDAEPKLQPLDACGMVLQA